MKQKSAHPISPDFVYTPETAADSLGVTPRWIRDKLINTGKIPIVREGQRCVFTGRAILQWVEENAEFVSSPSFSRNGPHSF